MLPALSQVCSLAEPFEKDIEEYAAGACRAIEIWLGKLETFLAGHSINDARRVLEENRVTAPVASYQGGLFTAEPTARREHWNLFHKRLSYCAPLGIRTLVVAADLAKPAGEEDLENIRATLVAAARAAQDVGVRLALEFQARAPFTNNLQTAAALVYQVGSPALGICLDAFHYQVGPSKPEDLLLLDRTNLFHVQLCDLSDVLRESAADADRILPGDGQISLATIVERLHAIDYDGAVSVELMNPVLWQVPARQFGEIAITALRKTLGLAAMA
ncbi:MAG: sugar phosphate isomerase/epimerase family protein [Pirellulales bacterium]